MHPAGARYIVCSNEAQAEKDRVDRQAIVAGLAKRLEGGDKALVGNKAYRRYLRKTSKGAAFEIDPGKLADEARYDGLFVLRTIARVTPLNAVLRYRDLLQVEELFRRAQGGAAHPAPLPLLRRRHPRPRLLLVSGAGASEGVGRPLPGR